MSKSIQERLKQLENTFRACCNKLFKLIERVDNLEIEVSEEVAKLSGAVFTGDIQSSNFKSSAIQNLTGLVWTGTTAPSGDADLKYRWTQKGKEVTLIVTGMYSVAGSALTQVRFPLPDNLPVPVRPAGIAAVSNYKCYIGSGHLTNSLTLLSTATTNTYIVVNSADTSKFDVVLVGATAAHLAFYGSITYYTL